MQASGWMEAVANTVNSHYSHGFLGRKGGRLFPEDQFIPVTSPAFKSQWFHLQCCQQPDLAFEAWQPGQCPAAGRGGGGQALPCHPLLWSRPASPATGKPCFSSYLFICLFFLFGEYCLSIFSHCCGNSKMHTKGKEKKEERKQHFKAQPIWLYLPLWLRNVSLFCPCACKGKQELEREVVPNCLRETVGKNRSQKVWESHQASSVCTQLPSGREQQPLRVTQGQCCSRAVVFPTTSPSLRGLRDSLTIAGRSSSPDAWAWRGWIGAEGGWWGPEMCRMKRDVMLAVLDVEECHALTHRCIASAFGWVISAAANWCNSKASLVRCWRLT